MCMACVLGCVDGVCERQRGWCVCVRQRGWCV